MNWRERWERFGVREKRLIIVAGVVLGLLVVRVVIVSPFLTYRSNLRDRIAEQREWLDNAHAYMARSGEVERNSNKLRDQVRQIRGQLIPGKTPDLAAANLQDTLHGLAATAGVEIRSTQKMRDEPIDDFRKIAVRITITGEVRALAEFLAGIEYDSQRLLISFFEISRRGAVLRNKGARALSATIEVSGFIQGEHVVQAAAPKKPTKPKKPIIPKRPKRPKRPTKDTAKDAAKGPAKGSKKDPAKGPKGPGPRAAGGKAA